MPGLVPGGRDHHGLHGRLLQPYVTGKGFPVAETVEMTGDAPAAFFGQERHLKALIGILCRPGIGVFRQLQLSHGEGGQYCLGVLPGMVAETKQRHGLQTDIAVVRNGEGSGKALSQHQIVIPLLDPPGRRLDTASLISLNHGAGPARFPQLSVRIQQMLSFCHFMISSHGRPPCRIRLHMLYTFRHFFSVIKNTTGVPAAQQIPGQRRTGPPSHESPIPFCSRLYFSEFHRKVTVSEKGREVRPLFIPL